MNRTLLFAVTVFFVPVNVASVAANWPQFRGSSAGVSEDGDTFVIQAGPQLKVLSKNALDEMCMATPAAHRGSLIIRTVTKLYRISD